MKLLTGANPESELIFLSLGPSQDYTGLVNIIAFSECLWMPTSYGFLISFLTCKIILLIGALPSYSREDFQVGGREEDSVVLGGWGRFFQLGIEWIGRGKWGSQIGAMIRAQRERMQPLLRQMFTTGLPGPRQSWTHSSDSCVWMNEWMNEQTN